MLRNFQFAFFLGCSTKSLLTGLSIQSNYSNVTYEQQYISAIVFLLIAMIYFPFKILTKKSIDKAS